MSAENVEVIRRGFDALNRRDIETVLELCDPRIELTPFLVGGVEQTTYRGRDGYRRWFEQQFETYDDVSFELHDIRAVGDRVVALFTMRVRGAHSGIKLDSPGASVSTLRAGLVTEQIGFQSHAEALEAVGLPASRQP